MTDTAPQRSGLPALTRRIHFYAGLFVAPFIFVAALSGAIYAVAPSLENLVYRDVLTVEAEPGDVPLGTPGEMYAELAASWLWVVALGGLFLWARVARTRVFTGLETTSGRRKGVLNLHGVAGTGCWWACSRCRRRASPGRCSAART